jgi:hypothetical protein
LRHSIQEAALSVVLREDMLLRGREQAEALSGRARLPERPIEAVKEAAADFVLFKHRGHRLALIDCGVAFAAALGVSR